jgi:hypothetical protein
MATIPSGLQKQLLPINSGPFYEPVDGNKIVAWGTITVLSAPFPCKVFAKVLVGDWRDREAEIPHPWDPQVGPGVVMTDPKDEGSGLWSWRFEGDNAVPGARGNCQTDTLVVWVFFEDSLKVHWDGDLAIVGFNCGSGSGSGVEFLLARGDAQGTITTPCCERQLPATLTGSITAKTGTATGLPDTVTFTYSDHTQSWETSFSQCGGGQFQLSCTGSSYLDFILTGTNSIQAANLLSGNCDPFVLDFAVTADPALCSGTFRVTITE